MDCLGIKCTEHMDFHYWDIRCDCLMDDENLSIHKTVTLGKRREVHFCKRCWMAITGEVLSGFHTQLDPITLNWPTPDGPYYHRGW